MQLAGELMTPEQTATAPGTSRLVPTEVAPASSPPPPPAAEPPEALRVEFRCPEPSYSRQGVRHPGPLFAVMVLAGAPPEGRLELACQRCKQRMARSGRPVRRVIHRYGFAGDLVDTLMEADSEEKPG